ncbi:UPF0481 protein [Camellia lanceoleosa]|nr:UPF0481 protein [Camellia lanceoleosa]
MEKHIVDIEEGEAMTYEPPCIFRVHEGLRNVNKEAYTPMLVSIGPYHYGQTKLLAMEKHKERYLKLVLQRTNQTEKYYLDSMKKLEERARKYYADPIEDDLNSDNLIVKVNEDNNHKLWVMITTPLSTHHG